MDEDQCTFRTKWDLRGITDAQRMGIRSHVELAGELLSPVYRMTTFIHHNPLHEQEDRPFFEAIDRSESLLGSRTTLSQEEWRAFFDRGHVGDDDLLAILSKQCPDLTGQSVCLGSVAVPCLDLLRHHMLYGLDPLSPEESFRLPDRRASLRLRSDLESRVLDRHRQAGWPGEGGLAGIWEAITAWSATSGLEETKDSAPGGLAEVLDAFLKMRADSMGRDRTLLEWVDEQSSRNESAGINTMLTKWLSAFLDEGVSNWSLPGREKGFYASWLALARHDRDLDAAGLVHARREISDLPVNPENTVLGCLETLGIPRHLWTDYLERHLARLPGWGGYIKWRNSRSDDPWQQAHPVDLVMLLAVRLFLEQALVGEFCHKTLNISGNIVSIERWMCNNPEEAWVRSKLASPDLPPLFVRHLENRGSLPPSSSPQWGNLAERLHASLISDRTVRLASLRNIPWRLFNLAQILGLSRDDLTALSPETVRETIGLLDRVGSGHRARNWVLALEHRYRTELFPKLTAARESPAKRISGGNDTAHPGTPQKSPPEMVRPPAQVFFCIDVRSERFRRHLEAAGGYETFGLGGFFGIPFRFQPFNQTVERFQGPVLINPRHRVREVPRAYHIEQADRHVEAFRKTKSLFHLFHELKDHVVTPYVLVEAIGWFYLIPFLGKTFFPGPLKRLVQRLKKLVLPEIATALTVDKMSIQEAVSMVEAEQVAIVRQALVENFGNRTPFYRMEFIEALRQAALQESPTLSRSIAREFGEFHISMTQEALFIRNLRKIYRVNSRRTDAQLHRITSTGFTLEEQAFYIENSLKMIGLVRNFSRLVLVCGHGSDSDNNPFESALDCGACGGNRGNSNARVYVEMANNPAVRDLLRRRNISIPYDTHFLAGEHNTTTDRITFFDLEAVPLTHRRDLKRLWQDLDAVGVRTAAERAATLPRANGAGWGGDGGATARRSQDWSEVRPEWGLSGNAGIVIGGRDMVSGVDFSGRAFLHSYDWTLDLSGRDLETIMTGPLVVAQWINMEHFFSVLDPEKFGGGNKINHNVVGKFGVMNGNQSDLLVGLPLQTLGDGKNLFHDPVRLLTVIEAPRERVESIVTRNPVLKQIFGNGWALLACFDPERGEFFDYLPPGHWREHGVSGTEPETRRGS